MTSVPPNDDLGTIERHRAIVRRVRARYPNDPLLAALDDEEILALAGLMVRLARSAAARAEAEPEAAR